jgi:hypothetical protein
MFSESFKYPFLRSVCEIASVIHEDETKTVLTEHEISLTFQVTVSVT